MIGSLLSIIAPYAFQAFQGELIQARPFIQGKYERRLNQLQASNRAQELGAIVRFSLEDNNWLTGHNSSVRYIAQAYVATIRWSH